MFSTALITIVAISSVWVYLDASKNKIGKIPGEKGMLNMSAGAWGITTMFLWIIAFPAYLIKRSAHIAKAQAKPIEVTRRGMKTGALAVWGGLAVFSAISNAALSTLPSCDSSNTQQLVGQIINDMPLMKSFGAQFVSIKDIAEQGYNDDAGIRACTSTLVTTVGENSLQYSIKWNEQNKGEFYVVARIQ